MRSFEQSPADESNIDVEFNGTADTAIANFHFGPYNQTSLWLRIDSILTAPVGTRSITVKLRSVRFNRSNNDGYYDEISLEAVQSVDVSKINYEISFSVYPNPSKSHFTIAFPESVEEELTFTLSNLMGQKLETGKISNQKTELHC